MDSWSRAREVEKVKPMSRRERMAILNTEAEAMMKRLQGGADAATRTLGPNAPIVLHLTAAIVTIWRLKKELRVPK